MAYVELVASIERFCSFVLFYIYDSNSNILRPKGVLLLLNILTKRSTPFTLEGVPKMTKMNIYYCTVEKLEKIIFLNKTLKTPLYLPQCTVEVQVQH